MLIAGQVDQRQSEFSVVGYWVAALPRMSVTPAVIAASPSDISHRGEMDAEPELSSGS